MRPLRARYVTACQQMLALGVVLVALAPAAGVVSLDVVGVEPDRAPAPTVELKPHRGLPASRVHDGALHRRDLGQTSWRGVAH